jgi:hypothetical protein
MKLFLMEVWRVHEGLWVRRKRFHETRCSVSARLSGRTDTHQDPKRLTRYCRVLETEGRRDLGELSIQYSGGSSHTCCSRASRNHVRVSTETLCCLLQVGRNGAFEEVWKVSWHLVLFHGVSAQVMACPRALLRTFTRSQALHECGGMS